MGAKGKRIYAIRWYFSICLLIIGFSGLIWRLFYLGVNDRVFLQKQGLARILRVVDIPASRGMILDRNGFPLAISTPVDAVWINPQFFEADAQQLASLANLLGVSTKELKFKITNQNRKWFIYLKRHVTPEVADQIKALQINGLFLQREYQRYYPEGEVTAHVLGFTNVDDQGIEGLELAFNSWLRGVSGKIEVLKDRLGHIIAVLRMISEPQQGHNLVLSIDQRIQYLAYSELKKTTEKYRAVAGSIVVLDVKTGEILAMVNQPSYNPNNRIGLQGQDYRNRAVTDVFEPGSTIKTFSIINALLSNKYKPDSKIDTSPGWYVVKGNVIKDEGVNHGMLTLTQVLQKSSNIGIAKVALSLSPQSLVNLLRKFGFAERTGSSFPGEVAGNVVDMRSWRPFVLATLSFGYAISVTPLQLVSAYATIANEGIRVAPTFLKVSGRVVGKPIVDAKVAKQVVKMLQSVVEEGGTAVRAQVSGYQVAGKTGTARVAILHGYDKKQHFSTFVGIAPASAPRLVIVVVINNPQIQDFGGLVAAPTFAKIMEGSLRILQVPPDDLKNLRQSEASLRANQ